MEIPQAAEFRILPGGFAMKVLELNEKWLPPSLGLTY